MLRFYLILFLSLLFLGYGQKAVPELRGHRVHDLAKVLSQATINELEQKLKTYEDETSTQIAVLLISSLDSENLEEYSLRVVEEWKLGQKDKDNGALLLVAVADRKMRIEVGYGLEGALTDALSSQIIRNEMAPEFRRNDYDAGVIAGINGMISAIGGEYTVKDSSSSISFPDLSIGERIFLSLFIFGTLGLFTCIGLVLGKEGWFLYFFLIPFWGLFPLLFLGTSIKLFYTYLVLFPFIKFLIPRTKWGSGLVKKINSSGRHSGRGSSSSSWSSSSSSSSSSGFSGGGGSFGGGGSSGSW